MAYLTYDDVFEDLRYNRGNHTSNLYLVRTTGWFLQNLQETHLIPGDVLATMMGIGTWYMERGYLTDKQANWLKIHLVKYEEQIDPMKAYA
jgi:hypothetical protein